MFFFCGKAEPEKVDDGEVPCQDFQPRSQGRSACDITDYPITSSIFSKDMHKQ
jgi:hypothetical protein